jgi:hypothetical protein
LGWLNSQCNKKFRDVPADFRQLYRIVFVKNYFIKGVAMQGNFMTMSVRICSIPMMVHVFVINRTISAYRNMYLFCMMVMWNQVVSQKHGKTQDKNQRYVASSLQDCL